VSPRAFIALPLAALTLSACTPKAVPPAAPLGLDCAMAFDVQSARLTAQPRLTPAPEDHAQPYVFYSSDDARVSYLITRPGAPGHPAIMMQRAGPGGVKTSGCRYGSQKGYDQLMTYLDSLKTWHR
jgi:hypothetical protein